MVKLSFKIIFKTDCQTIFSITAIFTIILEKYFEKQHIFQNILTSKPYIIQSFLAQKSTNFKYNSG